MDGGNVGPGCWCIAGTGARAGKIENGVVLTNKNREQISFCRIREIKCASTLEYDCSLLAKHRAEESRNILIGNLRFLRFVDIARQLSHGLSWAAIDRLILLRQRAHNVLAETGKNTL